MDQIGINGCCFHPSNQLAHIVHEHRNSSFVSTAGNMLAGLIVLSTAWTDILDAIVNVCKLPVCTTKFRNLLGDKVVKQLGKGPHLPLHTISPDQIEIISIDSFIFMKELLCYC